jgi:hypothetical protein
MPLSTPLPNLALSLFVEHSPPSLLSSLLPSAAAAATAYASTNPAFSLKIQQQQHDASTLLCLGSLPLLHSLVFLLQGKKR